MSLWHWSADGHQKRTAQDEFSGADGAGFLGSFSRRVGRKALRWFDALFATELMLIRSVRLDIAEASRQRAAPQVRAPKHLLVLTAGKGNIGDQAMLESFLENTTFPVTLLVQHDDAHVVPPVARLRVTKFVVPNLFATRLWARRRNRRILASLIAWHSTVSVVGADIMDGGYEAVEAIIRFGILCMSNQLGTPSRVLGFSWNGHPPDAVRQALRLSQPQSLLCARDPHSYVRLRKDGGHNVRSVADMVFTLTSSEPYSAVAPWLESQSSRPIVILNASGILARLGVATDEYVETGRYLLDRGCSVLVLPHVIRAGDDDLEVCVEVAKRLGGSSNVCLVKDLLNPGQVAWLARQATAVLTGRMHLSIFCLNQGVPAAVISTQGKVSGLLELFGIEDLLVAPEPGFAKDAIAALGRILDDPTVNLRLRGRLAMVRQLAALNFAGLEEN